MLAVLLIPISLSTCSRPSQKLLPHVSKSYHYNREFVREYTPVRHFQDRLEALRTYLKFQEQHPSVRSIVHINTGVCAQV